jgi:hypothetical protein
MSDSPPCRPPTRTWHHVRLPLSVALGVPAARVVVVEVSADRDDARAWATFVEVRPVVALRSTVEQVFCNCLFHNADSYVERG